MARCLLITMSLMGFGSLLQSQQDTGSIPETATPPITAVGSENRRFFDSTIIGPI